MRSFFYNEFKFKSKKMKKKYRKGLGKGQGYAPNLTKEGHKCLGL
jgi:hypothetical protein